MIKGDTDIGEVFDTFAAPVIEGAMGAAVGKVAGKVKASSKVRAKAKAASRGPRCRRSVDEEVALFSPQMRDLPEGEARQTLPKSLRELQVR